MAVLYNVQRDGQMFSDCLVNAAFILTIVKNKVAQCLNGAGKELPQENE